MLSCLFVEKGLAFSHLYFFSWRVLVEWDETKKLIKKKQPKLNSLFFFSIFSLSISKPFLLFTDPSLLPFPTTGSYCPSNAEQNTPASSSQIQTITCNVPTTKVLSISCEIPEN